MGGDAARRGNAGSPGSGGASPYLPRGFPHRPALRCNPIKLRSDDMHACSRPTFPVWKNHGEAMSLGEAIREAPAQTELPLPAPGLPAPSCPKV